MFDKFHIDKIAIEVTDDDDDDDNDNNNNNNNNNNNTAIPAGRNVTQKEAQKKPQYKR